MKKIKTKAIMDNFNTLLDFIGTCSQEAGCDKKLINKIRLACEEIIVNVCNYAYPEIKGDIEITCDVQFGKSITITFIDQGIPFNPLEKEAPEINVPVNERQIGGLGIFIVRQIMDEVEYRRDGSNILKVKKYLQHSA